MSNKAMRASVLPTDNTDVTVSISVYRKSPTSEEMLGDFNLNLLMRPEDVEREEYSGGLNREQQEVVSSKEKSLLVVASPGSGKTKTLTERVVHLIRNKKVDPKKILMITFTRKAANEMKERLIKLVGNDALKVTCSTFHSWAHKIMRIYYKDFGVTKDFPLLDGKSSLELFAKCAELINLTFKSPGEVRGYYSLYSLMQNRNLSAQKVVSMKNSFLSDSDIEEKVYRLTHISRRYSSYKKQYGIMDFDDLLVRTAELLSTANFRRKLARMYSHILVDEVQDSNKHQIDMLRFLVKGSIENKRQTSLFACGDEAQSIYAFRGADYRNMASFPEVFDGKVKMLLTNYRSSQQLLDFANQISDNFTGSRWKKHMVGTFQGRKPVYIKLHGMLQKAYIVYLISKMLRDGFKGKNIAVLFRNNFVGDMIESELISSKIDVERRGGRSFLEFSIVRDVLAVIKSAFFSSDVISWDRMLRLLEGIGAVKSESIYKQAFVSDNPVEFLIQDKHKKSISTNLLGLAMKAALDNAKSPVKAIQAVIESLEPIHHKKYELKYQKLKNTKLKALLSLASQYPTVKKMLTDITLNADANEKDNKELERKIEKKQGGRVVLSTQHGSKGLEFDTVIIPNVCEPDVPNRFLMFGMTDIDFKDQSHISFAHDDPDLVDEERRLFYVACTRARHNLIIIQPMRTVEYSYFMTGKPIPPQNDFESRFMKEIPNLDSLVENISILSTIPDVRDYNDTDGFDDELDDDDDF